MSTPTAPHATTPPATPAAAPTVLPDPAVNSTDTTCTCDLDRTGCWCPDPDPTACELADCLACYPEGTRTDPTPTDPTLSNPTDQTTAAVRAAGIEPALFAAYCSHQNTENSTEHLSAFTDNYAGTWDTERDYAAAWADNQHAADGTPVPEPFASYFDAAAYARDLFRYEMFSITLPHGDVAVFRSH